MKKYSTQQLRNIGLFGHGSSGKTTLTEAMLFATGAIDRMGSVTGGNTVSDNDPDEINRGISLYSTVVPAEYKNTKINIIDTPGFLDFIAQVRSSMRVVEGGVFMVSGNSGVEVGLERVWKISNEHKMAKIFFINKMDKENSDFYKCIDEIGSTLKTHGDVVPVQLPIGVADKFTGVVDLLENCAYKFSAGKAEKIDIPADMKSKVDEYAEKLAEAAAGDDEALMEKFFEGALSSEDVKASITKRIKKGEVFPVLCGSAEKNFGVTTLLDTIIDYFPNPAEAPEVTAQKSGSDDRIVVKPDAAEPLAALVFKTTADPYVGKLSVLRVYSGTLKADSEVLNVGREANEKISALMIFKGKTHETVDEVYAGDIITVAKLSVTVTSDSLCTKERPIVFDPIEFPEPLAAMAVYPKSKGDEDKLGSVLNRILEEDPTLKVNRDKMTKETVIYGMGELHLGIVTDKLKRKFGVDVDLQIPKIPYKETIKGKASQEYKHKKQSGGRGQYGHVVIELEPLPRDMDFEFVDKIVGGVVPKNYIPSVEKGVRKAMEEGFIAGYPVVSVRTSLVFGSYHTVDSSDIAFQIAAGQAFKQGATKAQPILLEPVMDVEVIVPESFMGDVMGDMNSRRGRIMGMDPIGDGQQSIKSQVPLAEMQKYSIDLRSITQGRGEYKMKFSHYEEVPALIAEPIIAAANKPQE
ncbi:MAG: elongation factor G [Firmicutes bacterium]|nr:elongation factor G [Bacillota bacterium]